MVSGILPTSSISVGNHGCDTGVRYASLFFDRCCGSRKKRSLPTPRGKISFFLRFGEPLSLRESGVLKSPYRNLKKTDTPVWVCPFAFIKFFEYRGTLRSRIFRTLRAFGEKSRVLETTQSAAAARRCGCFGEPLSLRENGVLKSPYRNLKKRTHPFGYVRFWLRYRDSNPDKQSQRLLCYLYTISQYLACVSSLYIILHFENLSRGLIVNFQ